MGLIRIPSIMKAEQDLDATDSHLCSAPCIGQGAACFSLGLVNPFQSALQAF